MVFYHLLIEMYAKDLTKEKLAEQLLISEQSLHDKIYGLTPFTNEEMENISDLFPLCEKDYLFCE